MAYDFSNIKILIVEDNMPMQELSRSILQTFGVGEVTAARNGRDGFESFCEYNHDIVIADWMMQPIDGISLTRMIRNDSQSPNQYAPVILMTGFGDKERVFEARDAGVTEFLVKPFNTRDLYSRLVQIIEKPRQFVRSREFFGPDRRRRKSGDYRGDLKRETDIDRDDITFIDYTDNNSPIYRRQDT